MLNEPKTCSFSKLSRLFFFNFGADYKPGYRLCICRGGKSGQHRAAHHLTGGVPRKRDTESATENNRLHLFGGKGENVG